MVLCDLLVSTLLTISADMCRITSVSLSGTGNTIGWYLVRQSHRSRYNPRRSSCTSDTFKTLIRCCQDSESHLTACHPLKGNFFLDRGRYRVRYCLIQKLRCIRMQSTESCLFSRRTKVITEVISDPTNVRLIMRSTEIPIHSLEAKRPE